MESNRKGCKGNHTLFLVLDMVNFIHFNPERQNNSFFSYVAD